MEVNEVFERKIIGYNMQTQNVLIFWIKVLTWTPTY